MLHERECSRRGCHETRDLRLNSKVMLASGIERSYYLCSPHFRERWNRNGTTITPTGKAPDPNDEWAWRRASIESRKRILERHA